MSDQATPSVPAGWYPDPEGSARGRYWDGTAWTENYHVPGQPAPQLRAPEGTDPYTPWIWAFVLLPLLGYLPLPFFPWASLFEFDPREPGSVMDAQFAIFTSPAYLAAVGSGLVIYGVSVLLAYLDHRALVAREVPKPFHWAWAFIPSYGTLVYPIGRTVVIKGRTGRGLGPIWVMIGVFLAGLIVSLVMVAQMMSAMTGMLDTLR